MRQIGHQRVVHAEPKRRELPHRDHAADEHDKGSYDNPPRRSPEKPLVSLDEQLIQVFKTLSLACDARVHTDALPDRIQANALQGDRMGHDRILQQLLTHRGIVDKGQYLPQCRYTQKGTCDHTGHSHCHRNHEPHERKGVCGAQQQEHHDPQRRCVSHLAMHPPALFIIPQPSYAVDHLNAYHVQRNKQALPKRQASRQGKHQRTQREADKRLRKRVEVINKGVFPRVHAKQDHGIVLVL